MSEPTPPAAELSAPSAGARAEAAARLDRLTKPRGALGALEPIAVWAAGVQDSCPPQLFRDIEVVVVAGDHGIAATAGTSAYPVEVTAQMVANIAAGGAAVNVLARHLGAAVQVVDASVAGDYEGLPVPPDLSRRRIRAGSGSIDREDALTAAENERRGRTGSRDRKRVQGSRRGPAGRGRHGHREHHPGGGPDRGPDRRRPGRGDRARDRHRRCHVDAQGRRDP